jgi:ribosomal protein L4
MAVPTYTASGSKAATPAKLDAKVFGVKVENHQLVRQAYDTYLSNGRENLAVVKTRGLVRGGGIVFGPTGEENYTKKLPVAAKRLAIRQALSLASDAGKIVVVEKLASKEGKTSEIVKLMSKLGVNRSSLVVVTDKTPELVRATANLQDVKLVSAMYVNVFDVMNADTIVLTNDALSVVHEWLGGTK